MLDIIDQVRAEHRKLLTLHRALLDAVLYHGQGGPAWALARIWDRLTLLLETHMDAEEEICYLPMLGTSALALRRLEVAVAAHDDIRWAVAETTLHSPATHPWWRAVTAALSASDQLSGAEERDIYEPFACRASAVQRAQLARQWQSYTTAARSGVTASDDLTSVDAGERLGG